MWQNIDLCVPRLRSMSMPDIPSTWSRDMDMFYNELDDRYLDMSIDDVLNKLPANANWDVDRADVYGGGGKSLTNFH